MADKNKALELELRQIIQADRNAVDILRQSEDTRKTVEARTEQEKKAILADAEKKRADMEALVQKEIEEEMQRKLEAEESAFGRQKQKLEQALAQNRDAWVEEITANILNRK